MLYTQNKLQNFMHSFVNTHRNYIEKLAQHRDQYHEHMHSMAHQSLDSSIKALENAHAQLSSDESGFKSDIMAAMIKKTIDHHHHFKKGLNLHKIHANNHKQTLRRLAMGAMMAFGVMSGVKAAGLDGESPREQERAGVNVVTARAPSKLERDRYAAEYQEISEARKAKDEGRLYTFALDCLRGINGRIKDETRAKVYFREAANLGKPEGLLMLGIMAYKTNPEEGHSLLRQAYIEGATPPSTFPLWEDVTKGLEPARQKFAYDKEIATVRKGPQGPDALHDLGYDYLQGKGGKPKDEKHAVEIFEILHHEFKNAYGTLTLAKAHLYGWGGLTQDEGKTKELFKKANLNNRSMKPTFSDERAKKIWEEVEKERAGGGFWDGPHWKYY